MTTLSELRELMARATKGEWKLRLVNEGLSAGCWAELHEWEHDPDHGSSGYDYQVRCTACLAESGLPARRDPAKAITTWNTRQAPKAGVVTASDEMVERAAEAYLQVVDQFSKKQINHMSAQLLNARHKVAMRAALEAGGVGCATDTKFRLGDRVRKTKGSSWQGIVVGTYSTKLTAEGYAVESEREPGSVQIYPAGALEMVPDGPEGGK